MNKYIPRSYLYRITNTYDFNSISFNGDVKRNKVIKIIVV